MAEIKNGKLQLPNVTLAAMTSVNRKATLKALEYSMRGIDFGEVVFISDKKPLHLPDGITYEHIDPLTDINSFNYNMVYSLYKYVHRDFCLTVHADGFVVHPEVWRDDFLAYDYIGSPWPDPHDDFTYRDINGNLIRVGNSVGIRSYRLLEYPDKVHMPFEADHGWFNEDGFICVKMRHRFLEAGMTYAPLEVAVHFGHEKPIPEEKGTTPFLFHKWEGDNAQYPRFRMDYDGTIGRVRKKLDAMKRKG